MFQLEAMIQINNEPYIWFRHLLNIWICLCSVIGNDFWSYEIRFVIIKHNAGLEFLNVIIRVLRLGFNYKYTWITELKSFQNWTEINEEISLIL